MPEPEQDWVGRAIPPAPHWIVGRRWYGLFDHVTYASPAECFAANRTCRQDLVREPIPYHCRPVAKPDAQSAHSADVPGGGCHDAHPDTDSHDDDLSDAGDRGDSDAGRGHGAAAVRADNGHAGHAGDLLLDSGDQDPHPDADLPDMQHSSAGRVLPEGVMRKP